MTTGTHGYVPVTLTMTVAGAVMGVACPVTAAIGFLCGLPLACSAMLPDLIGVWGGSLSGDWDQYVRAHHGDIAKLRASTSIWYWFHLKIDALTHADAEMKPPPLNKTWQRVLLETAVLGACAGGLAHVYGIGTAILALAGVWSLPGLCVGASFLWSPHYTHPGRSSDRA